MKFRALVLSVLVTACGHAQPVPWWDTFVRVAGPVRAPERAAQVWAESGFNPRAASYRVLSNGEKRPLAFGLAQFIPATWARYGRPGASPFDPEAAIDAQHRYMTDLERLFAGDWQTALGAYNCGPGNIKRAQRLADALGFQGSQAWRKTLPKVTGQHSAETLAYVPRIVTRAELYRKRRS